MKNKSFRLTSNRKEHIIALWVLMILLVLAYLIDNLLLGPIVTGIFGNYILPILLWICLGVFALNLPPA